MKIAELIFNNKFELYVTITNIILDILLNNNLKWIQNNINILTELFDQIMETIEKKLDSIDDWRIHG